MSIGALLDLVLIVVLVLHGIYGYRRGLLLTVVGAVGFISGAGLAFWLLPDRLATLVTGSAAMLRPAILVFAVFVVATLGQGLLMRVFGDLARSVGRSPLGALDALLGGVLTMVVAAVTIWFSAGVLRVVVPGDLAKAIGQSRVVGTVDSLMPATSGQFLGQVKAALDEYGFPRVFSQMGAEPILPVEGADPGVLKTAGVARAAASILRINADATACNRTQEGTGWVAAPGLVVTNAHVVAGAEAVSVTTPRGDLEARVVSFDPRRDLAVLSVPSLTAPPLPLGGPMERGDPAVVAGYPLNGPYHLDAARVRDVLRARGDDIYGRNQVERKVYSLLAAVRPGNSGGPLLTPEGTVAGVVFARSLDDASTGYALTLDELRPVLDGASAAAAAVPTGACARS